MTRYAYCVSYNDLICAFLLNASCQLVATLRYTAGDYISVCDMINNYLAAEQFAAGVLAADTFSIDIFSAGMSLQLLRVYITR